jgi:hypothetical protein
MSIVETPIFRRDMTRWYSQIQRVYHYWSTLQVRSSIFRIYTMFWKRWPPDPGCLPLIDSFLTKIRMASVVEISLIIICGEDDTNIETFNNMDNIKIITCPTKLWLSIVCFFPFLLQFTSWIWFCMQLSHARMENHMIIECLSFLRSLQGKWAL